MKEMMRNTIISIGMAMTIFCLVGVIFDISYKGSFSLEGYGFTKMVVGCVLIGLGFGIPTIVYGKDRLPIPIRVIIHLGIGCVIYTIVAYAVGWVDSSATIAQGIMTLTLQLAVSFIIWFLFFRHYRAEARKMNEKIRELGQKHKDAL